MNKLLSLILSITLVLTVASCGKEDKVTFEMPYTTSAESTMNDTCASLEKSFGVKMKYDYKDNTATFTINSTDQEKILTSVNNTKSFFIDDYKKQGLINGIQFSDDCTDLVIDFPPTVDDDTINKIYTDFLGVSMSYQCFSGVPAKDFRLHVVITCGNETLLDTTIDQAAMIAA